LILIFLIMRNLILTINMII